MKNYICLVGLLIAGCNAPLAESYEVRIDPSFTPEQTATVEAACAAWNDAARGYLTLVVSVSNECDTDTDHRICIINSNKVRTTAAGGSSDALAHTTLHFFTDSSAVYISTDVAHDREELLASVGHEVGHALGLSHTGNDTLMATRYQPKDRSTHTPTAKDVLQYRTLRLQIEKR